MSRQDRIGKTAYFDSLSRAFEGQIDRLLHLIGHSHELSLGESREHILREFLREFLPDRYAVSTGFILFDDQEEARQRRRASSLEPSRQLDVIIWDRVEYAPLFSAGDFVVVPPGSVEAVMEVKSTLSYKTFSKGCGLLLDVSASYDEQREVEGYGQVTTPGLILFAWDEHINKAGKADIQASKAAGKVCSKVTEFYQDNWESEPYSYLAPISGVFVYRKWATQLTMYTREEDGEEYYDSLEYSSVEMADAVGGDHPDFTFRELLSLLSEVVAPEDDQLAWFQLVAT